MKIAMIGAGAMGGTTVEGLLRCGAFSAADITVSDLSAAVIKKFGAMGVNTTMENAVAASAADVVCVCVKPWLVEGVLTGIKGALDPSRQLLVVIAAGVSSQSIRGWLGSQCPPLFLVIPNIAIAQLASMTFIVPVGASPQQEQTITGLFGRMGHTLLTDEQHLAAGTTLASCGIAYAMRYIRAASEGGVELGFKADQAKEVVMQTVLGAVKLLEASGLHPEAAIDMVTTPGGVTIKGLNEMEHAGFTSSVIRGLKAGLRTVVLLACMAMGGAGAYAEEKTFASPDGKMAVTVDDNGGRPAYSITLDGAAVVERSPLGVKANFDDLTQGLSLKGCDVSTVSDDYMLATWKQHHVSYDATEAVCHYEKDGRRALDVTFRVTGRDVAFRYTVYPKKDLLAAVIEGEATAFVLPAATTTFLCPQSKPMGGFARTAPSYETSYTLDDQPGKNGWGEGYTFPCLFRAKALPAKEGSGHTPTGNVGTDCWILLSETGTDGGYVGCRLLGVDNAGEAASHPYTIGFPQAGEMNGWGTTTAAVALPCTTPWRTITVGTSLKPIVETTIANDLVKPKYKPSRDYSYGKGVWSWIIGMDASCNFDEQKRYVDFAADMGYRSVLVDALWDTQIGYGRMEELSRYAQSKGVGLFLWYNSNGTWNDAPQGPRHKMDRPAARRAEMAWMQKNGILGIKVDFFGGDKQPMMQLYEDILTDANDYGLQVIFHGCTLPRGWERMYPNYVASEAVLASENLHFGQGACDAEARNACTHTFIRNTVGSMDFGGSTLNKHYSTDNQRGTTRRTSDVFALATAVLFQSSVQHFALAPNNLSDAPAWAVDFMKAVPTTWDETRFIDGYPGRYAILARRSAGQWFIAAINAQAAPVKANIDLTPFFQKGTTVTAYTDDASLNGSSKTFTLKRTSHAASIPQNGALVIVGPAALR